MDTTKKMPVVTQMDEKQYAQFQYDKALKTMLENPTKENIDAFGRANAHLYAVEDAHRIALRLLTERAHNLANAALGLHKA
jgi:hypothetical protein